MKASSVPALMRSQNMREIVNKVTRIQFTKAIENATCVYKIESSVLQELSLSGTPAEIGAKEAIRGQILAAIHLRLLIVQATQEGNAIVAPIQDITGTVDLSDLQKLHSPFGGFKLLTDLLKDDGLKERFAAFEESTRQNLQVQLIKLFPELKNKKFTKMRENLSQHISKSRQLITNFSKAFLNLNSDLLLYCKEHQYDASQIKLWRDEIFRDLFTNIVSSKQYQINSDMAKFSITLDKRCLLDGLRINSSRELNDYATRHLNEMAAEGKFDGSSLGLTETGSNPVSLIKGDFKKPKDGAAEQLSFREDEEYSSKTKVGQEDDSTSEMEDFVDPKIENFVQNLSKNATYIRSVSNTFRSS